MNFLDVIAEPKMNNSKLVFIILIIVLGIGLISLGIFFLIKHISKKDEK